MNTNTRWTLGALALSLTTLVACGGPVDEETAALEPWQQALVSQFGLPARTVAAHCDRHAQKVTICHYPPGNRANAHTLSVGAPAVAAHFTHHGDTIGPCGDAEARDGGDGRPDDDDEHRGSRDGGSNCPGHHGGQGGGSPGSGGSGGGSGAGGGFTEIGLGGGPGSSGAGGGSAQGSGSTGGGSSGPVFQGTGGSGQGPTLACSPGAACSAASPCCDGYFCGTPAQYSCGPNDAHCGCVGIIN